MVQSKKGGFNCQSVTCIITSYPMSILSQLLHRQIAVHVLGLFVEVEMEAFSKRLALFLPLLLRCLNVNDIDTDTGNDDGFVGDDDEVDVDPENEGLEKEIEDLDGDNKDSTPGRIVPNDMDVQGRTVLYDHLLFTTLSCFGKVLLSCHSVFADPSFTEVLDCLWSKLHFLYLFRDVVTLHILPCR